MDRPNAARSGAMSLACPACVIKNRTYVRHTHFIAVLSAKNGHRRILARYKLSQLHRVEDPADLGWNRQDGHAARAVFAAVASSNAGMSATLADKLTT